jgi:pyruvate kinase
MRDEIAEEAADLARRWRPQIKRRSFCLSSCNLAAYLALRRRDLRALQEALTRFGLSSLGRSEARVLANLDAVIATLERICGAPSRTAIPSRARSSAESGCWRRRRVRSSARSTRRGACASW